MRPQLGRLNVAVKVSQNPKMHGGPSSSTIQVVVGWDEYGVTSFGKTAKEKAKQKKSNTCKAVVGNGGAVSWNNIEHPLCLNLSSLQI